MVSFVIYDMLRTDCSYLQATCFHQFDTKYNHLSVQWIVL